jgi:hemerythrin-like metal-binding protein
MAHNLKRIVKRNQADLAMEPTDAPTVARRRRVHDKVPAALVWAAESDPSAVRLKWKKAYECGEPNIDAQHCELFTLANAAFDASFKMATEHAQFLAAIDRLLAHIVKHFAHEEETLAIRRYDDLAQHKVAHADVLAKGRALRGAVTAHRITTGDLVEFIADKVVAHHLFTADREFFALFSHQPAQH